MIIKKLLVYIQTFALILATSVSCAQAAMISTSQVLTQEQRQSQVAQIAAVLARDDVRDQFIALGLTRGEALHRIAALSDQELQQLSTQLNALPAGGDSFLALIGAVFVVLLILEVTGVINIFKGV